MRTLQSFFSEFFSFRTVCFLNPVWPICYHLLSSHHLVHHLLPFPLLSSHLVHHLLPFPPPFHLVHHLLPFPLATQIGHLLQPGWYQIYLFNLVISQDSHGENTGQSPDEGGEGELDLAVSTSPEIGTKRTKGRSKSKVTISTGDSDNELPGT